MYGGKEVAISTRVSDEDNRQGTILDDKTEIIFVWRRVEHQYFD